MRHSCGYTTRRQKAPALSGKNPAFSAGSASDDFQPFQQPQQLSAVHGDGVRLAWRCGPNAIVRGEFQRRVPES
jgi:hypothetical protein